MSFTHLVYPQALHWAARGLFAGGGVALAFDGAPPSSEWGDPK
jgi:hypothetical protein